MDKIVLESGEGSEGGTAWAVVILPEGHDGRPGTVACLAVGESPVYTGWNVWMTPAEMKAIGRTLIKMAVELEA